MVFDLHNAPARQTARAIDPDAEAGEEPPLDALFREWRESATRRFNAPVALVSELFGEALAGSGEQTDPDLGSGALHARAERVLAALGRAAPRN